MSAHNSHESSRFDQEGELKTPMGYDLSNASGGYVRFSGSGWDLAVAVARHYGWRPAGIPKPATWDEAADGAWEDGYHMNAGQQVTAEDAAALAAALDQAISAGDFVETVQRIHGGLGEQLDALQPRQRDAQGALTHGEAAQFRERLRALSALAHEGAFLIE